MEKPTGYSFPFTQKEYQSIFSGVLEINLVDGKKVLDTANSNYSYGTLQKILQRGLEEINFDDTIQSVLVLGMGGGSIVETIRHNFKSNTFIELIDIDEEIIAIAKNEFELEKYGNISLVLNDAADYIQNTKQYFDVIVVDIFIGDRVPSQFTETKFLTKLSQHLNANGKIIFNTMRNTLSREHFNRITKNLTESGLRVRIIEKLQITNDLIIGEK
ncbi:MAG: methyltransferase domain-containing protein [Bacteroidia bacterium]|nr:methyltransferase domain-containing protein [Bacteroidia bacterium]